MLKCRLYHLLVGRKVIINLHMCCTNTYIYSRRPNVQTQEPCTHIGDIDIWVTVQCSEIVFSDDFANVTPGRCAPANDIYLVCRKLTPTLGVVS